MIAIDIVKPAATNNFEDWTRWLNWTESRLRTALYARGKTIEVKCGHGDYEIDDGQVVCLSDDCQGVSYEEAREILDLRKFLHDEV